MSEWPEHSQELGRKAMERIQVAVARYQDKQTAGEARLLWHVADILSEVTQGLIDQDVWKTIYAVRGEAKKEAEKFK